MADQVWELVKSRIASHMIGTYQSRVEAKCKELSLRPRGSPIRRREQS